MKRGFTLAEVLITLGIIGVVAAMTMPTLNAKFQKREFITELKKIYSEIYQALGKLALNNEELTYDKSSAEKMIENSFKIIKKCPNGTFSPCVAEKYKKLSGNEISLSQVKQNANDRQCYTIASGAGICVFSSFTTSAILTQIAIDVNGTKQPNVAGRDLFLLYIYNNNKIDDLVTYKKDENDNTIGDDWMHNSKPPTQTERETMFETICNNKAIAGFHGCFGKILNDNWEMNY